MSATPNFTSYITYPGSSLFPSLLDLKITSSSILNPQSASGGTLYDAWCMVENIDLPVPATYTTALYSSYEIGTLVASVPTLANNKYLANLDNINWLLNWYNGKNAAYGDVQGAIWKMLGSPAIVDYVGPQNAATIDALVAEALKHDGYVPEIGGTIAAIVDPLQGSTHRQPLLVTMQAASIGDRVWHDANANGIQDAGETGIANVTVQLVRDQNQDGDFNDANEVLATTTTDSQGNYVFKGLTPGLNYQVVFSLPSGYEFVSPRQADGKAASGSNSDALVSNIVVLAPGENNNTIDAGFYNKASLGDRLWLDANGNGQQDAGENGIAGQTVTLIGGGKDGLISTAADNTSLTATTDANGNYKFTGLTPGVEYQVQFSAPAGSVFTAQDKGSDASDSDVNGAGLSQIVKLSSGENNLTIDAGVYLPASLGDRLWFDANGNGQQDADEAGIAGAKVTLIGGGADGLLSTTADNTSVTATTDANGNYKFTGLTPGVEYQVQFAAPDGTVFTAQDKGSDAGDSDVNGAGLSQIVKLVSGENNPTIDAGVYVPASLGDRVWVDANGNGQQDSGEVGVANATVTLIGGGADGLISTTADNTSVTTTTDANGNYKFTGLTPGIEYQVQFTAPDGAVFTMQDKGDDASDSDANAKGLSQIVKLSSGENNTTIDAGIYTPASLGDRVWIDANGNGQQDANEAGVANATVTLIGGGADGLLSTTADNTSVTTTTDANGNYKFAGLTPGVEYQVQFAAPAGAVFTAQDKGDDVSDSDANAKGLSQVIKLGSGENNTTIDAGIYVPASLGDRVWVDANGNGQQDSGEAGVANATVTLIGGGADGLISTTADNTSATTTTDANGNYKFTGLTPGVEYQVQFAAPDGSVFTAQDKGDDASDSDANSKGLSQIVKLSSGENNTSIDAGVYTPASLGDRLWIDANGNGQQDANEAGVANAIVTLIGGGTDGLISTTADNTSVTTTTDANGNYKFTGLTPGVEYQVQFAAPDGSVFTTQDKGDDASDSDANSKGLSQIVKLSSGENNTTIDAGVYVPASLGDRVWIDANGNGQQDSGEAGVANATVTLIGGGADGLISTTADNTTVTTTTDANGNYKFTGLIPGVEYQVQFTAPTGSVFTTQDKGDDANDSDVNSKGLSQIVKLGSGENNTTIDAGIYTPATLGDRVWVDANGNGQQDANEIGVANATVTLIGGGADGLISTTADNTSVTTTTDANGNYKFTGLTPGVEYQVQFTAPAGAVFTAQDKGDDASDSDVNSKGLSQIVKLTSGENNTTIDAGIYTPATLGDRVWIDANGNGQQDANEAGVANATVTLIGGGADGLISTTADNTSITTTTDASGNYKFINLTPGIEYQVQFSAPAGTVFTTQDKGSDTSDSDADAITGKSQIVKLVSGENNTTIDAGIYAPASLGDRVWADANGNGIQDAGEANVAGVVVNLVNADGKVIATRTTGSDGLYLFDNLAPGSYRADFDLSTLPAGYVVTSKNAAGSTSLNDSDADPLTGRTGYVTLASGTADRSLDLGIKAGAVGISIQTLEHGEYVVHSSGSKAEGLTPGFWKNHTGAGGAPLSGWPETGLSPNASYEALFGVDVPGGAPTLLDALSTTGGGMDALLRHSAAALLNAANPYLNYVYDQAQVIALVRAAFASGNYEATKDLLAAQNQLEGSLTDLAPTGATFVTADLDANTAGSGTAIPVGGTAVFTYIVKNTGTVALGNVSVTDPRIANLTYVSGDTNRDGKLDVNETWTYKGAEVVSATGSYVHVGTATAKDLITGLSVSASDAANYSSTMTVQSLGDRVWLDSNANGVQDAGEAGVAGVTVQLKSTSGAILQTTTTDANGKYLFNVAAGSYTVTVQTPAGYSVSPKNVGSDDTNSDIDPTTKTTGTITVGIGEQNLKADAGIYQTASLGNRVWIDANGNGQQDAGETGTSGLTVTLTSGGADGLISTTADNTTVTTTTGADGAYLFSGLKPGVEYQVQFSKPTGYSYTLADTGSDLTDSDANVSTGKSQIVKLASGENNTSVDAGLVPVKGSIGDLVWEDLNYNGLQDAGESGIANVTVRLLDGSNNVLATTVTNSSGNYLFSNLNAGSYKVQVVQPSGYLVTKANVGTNGTLDSNIDTLTATSGTITLAQGQNDTGVDAGLYRKASIGDKVWADTNRNGIQDVGESGLQGVKVMLYSGAGALLSTTTTDANGNYKFANIDPGSYYLAFDKTNVVSGGYNLNSLPWSSKMIGTNGAVDSNVAGDGVATTNLVKTDVTTLTSGENDMSWDAGITPIAIDLNGDGVHTVARSVSVASGASFDLLGNGTAITSGWLSSSDGFLAVDLNGNGKIDGIGELFGGSAKGDGFARLASYDSNGDGVVDAHDAAFASLVIWRDANGNHATDSGELMSLLEAGVVSLTVAHTDLPFVDAQGNLHLERSSATLANGAVADMTDVYFAIDAKDAPNAATFADLIGGNEPLTHVQVGLVGQAPVLAA